MNTAAISQAATSAGGGSINVMGAPSTQRIIPQTSAATTGSSPHVKAALNKKIRGAQERSKTSYNARQIQTLQLANKDMNRTNYADQKSNTLQADGKKQQRAQQVYQNINNLIEN